MTDGFLEQRKRETEEQKNRETPNFEIGYFSVLLFLSLSRLNIIGFIVAFVSH